MTRLHVLAGDIGGRYRCVLHEPVSAGNNAVGVAWRTALIRSKLGGTTILPDGDGNGGTISAAEKTQIVNGEIIEIILDFQDDPAWNTTQRNAALDNEITKHSAEVLIRLQAQLRFFGYTRGA